MTSDESERAPDTDVFRDDSAEWRKHALEIAACICLAANIAATWPLWTGTQSLPQIPWFGWLCRVRPWVDAAAVGLGGIAMALLVMFSAVLWRRIRLNHLGTAVPAVGRTGSPSHDEGLRTSLSAARAVVLTALVVLLSLNQQRLQPWAYQILVLLIVISLAPAAHALRLARWLVISIYVWSAVSKFDAAYLTGIGPQLVHGLKTVLQWNAALWTSDTWRLAVIALPLGELLAAMFLMVPRWRRWGCLLTCMMHACLLAALGSPAMQQSAAVLIWNVFFLVQNGILFWGPVPQEKRQESRNAKSIELHEALANLWRMLRGLHWRSRWSWDPIRQRMATGVVLAVIALPTLEPRSYWDHWPSWSLYSARPETVYVMFPTHIPGMPSSDTGPLLLGHAHAQQGTLDFMSYDELRAPIYPQGRFRLAVALALAERHRIESETDILVFRSPERWTGERLLLMSGSAAELAAERDRYWFNTRPRE